MEKPGDIVGFKIGKALIDELDVMKAEKASLVWRKIIARMRYKVDGLKNGIDVTTTPEGFKFVYQQFVKLLRDKPALRDMYGLIHASTYDNEANLPDDYIDSLRASYPPQLIEAYLRGLFINLASGSVYPSFDRRLNHSNAVEAEHEPLHVGMDFNVLNMTATINVIRDGLPITVNELTEVRDTPAMALLLKERFKDKGHSVTIYPDASGQNTSSKNAAESDLSILKQAGFTVRVNSTNPAVRDRVNAVNAMILNDKLERRWKVAYEVDIKLAPVLAFLVGTSAICRRYFLSLIEDFPDAAISIWTVLPADIRAEIPADAIRWAGYGIIAIGIIARIVRQPRLNSEPGGAAGS